MRFNTALSGKIVFSSFLFKVVVEFNTSELDRLINITGIKWSI